MPNSPDPEKDPARDSQKKTCDFFVFLGGISCQSQDETSWKRADSFRRLPLNEWILYEKETNNCWFGMPFACSKKNEKSDHDFRHIYINFKINILPGKKGYLFPLLRDYLSLSLFFFQVLPFCWFIVQFVDETPQEKLAKGTKETTNRLGTMLLCGCFFTRFKHSTQQTCVK